MSGSIQVITAAAGAGKTTRIVRDIADEVRTRPPEAILATTFTIRAADELVERSRAALFEHGESEAATRLLSARFGTVNAVCGRIVAEFALDLGRSPATAVIGEANEGLVFSIAANAAIAARAPVLNSLADRFGYSDPRRPGSVAPDWRGIVREIVTLARANGLDAGGLARSAERSVSTFQQLLPPATADAAPLDEALAAALADAVAAKPQTPSKTAKDDLPAIEAAHRRAARGEVLSWSTWAKLCKLGCAPTKDGQGYQNALVDVMAAAARHSDHPRLREDTEQFIRGIFGCAAEALTAYQAHKAQQGLLDFTDQEALALEVLNDPALAARLRERVQRVFIDEFQDSSPLQVAVFTALAEIVETSTWVGDPKQAIFGFRGADTELTQAVFAGASGERAEDVLSVSWRSRPGIIRLANALFGPALDRMGLPRAQHAFSDARRSDAGFEREPLGWWPLAGKVQEQADALAQGLRQVLAVPGSWMVEERGGQRRPLASGDIAILCRTKTEVARIASAISRAGLPVAVERSGLARTPHVELVLAASGWLSDPLDRLALAELARFFGDDPESDAWLVAAAEAEPDSALRAVVPIAAALEALREQVLALTPAELLDAVLAIPDVIGLIERWGDHAMRLDDLEALRGVARSYEAECAASGAPATFGGLLQAIAVADPQRPASLAADAIQVMTYHGAKGLEWPMVVLTGLGWEPKARLFEPVAEVDGSLDWRRPLAGRWIRFWPWPYGQSGSSSLLEQSARESPAGHAAALRALHEETRLLYVGVTRARDYLVFAPPAAGTLNWLNAVAGEPEDELRLPALDDPRLRIGAEAFTVDYRRLAKNEAAGDLPRLPAFIRPPGSPTPSRPPLNRRPSTETGQGWGVRARIALGGRLRLDGVMDMAALGEALHAFIAYDDSNRPAESRVAAAAEILARWRVSAFAPEDAVVAADRLHGFLSRTWPAARVRREVPISARIGDQVVHGRMDLLVDDPSEYAIVDHKSFPGSSDQWEGRAIQYAPQLGLYARAVEAATGWTSGRLFVHMPIVGTLIEVGSNG